MEDKLVFKDFNFSFKEFDGWSLKHSHKAYEIFLLISGEIDIHVENRKYHIKHGDVFLAGPEFTHAYIADGKYSRYEIMFTKKFLDTYFVPEFRRKLLKCYTSEIIHLTEDEIDDFYFLYGMMEKEKGNDGVHPLHLANILYLLDKASSRQLENPILPEFMSKEMAAVTNVVTYINANYRAIRSMDEIADACFISKSYLCHVFKKEYGMTVMEYLKRVRIKYACEFLATSDKTFSLIATKMGFADISHFTKNFKSIKGCTPREYRERIRREQAEKKSEAENAVKTEN